MIAESAVEPHAVVEGFNVIKDGQLGFALGDEAVAAHQFRFERAQKLSMWALS